MGCRIKAVFLDEHAARLAPDLADKGDNLLILHGAVDILDALLIGKVSN